jgi:ribonuclease HI/exonuclease III
MVYDKEDSYKGKGTAILISNQWTQYFQPNETLRINKRVTAITFKRLTETVRIISIYYPANPTKEETLTINKEIKDIIKTFHDNDKIILAGDINNTLNPSIDRETIHQTTQVCSYPSQTTPSNKLFASLTNLYRANPLIDIWRLLYPDERQFTKTTENTTTRTISRSRIDIILISANLISSVINTGIHLGESIDYSIDHNIVSLTVSLPMDKLEARYGKETKSSHYSVNYKAITAEQSIAYNLGMEQDLEIKAILNALQGTQHCHNVDQRVVTKYYSILKKVIHRQAKIHLPVTTYVRSTGVYNTKLRSHSRIKQIHKIIFELKKIENNLQQATENELESLRTNHDEIPQVAKQQRLSQLECKGCATDAQRIRCSLTRLKDIITTYGTQNKREAMQHTLVSVYNNQKQFISNKLGNEPTKFVLKYIKVPEKDEFTSKPEEVQEYIAKHFNDIYSNTIANEYQENPERMKEDNPAWRESFDVIPGSREILKEVTVAFTQKELNEFIAQCNNGSAPGPDQLSYEHFRTIKSKLMLKMILDLLNNSLLTGNWPEDNNKGTITLLLKKDIYRGNASDLRPITLLQTIRKIFTGLLTNRLTKEIYSNNLLRGNNYGFTPGRSTNDYITILKHAIDHAKITNKKLYALLLDIEKAYDTVPEIALQLALNRIGASQHLIKIIRMLHRNRNIRIITAAGLSKEITPARGLPQGDKISPLLWNIFYDALLCKLDEAEGYAFSDNLQICKLAFADDLTTISDSIEKTNKHSKIVTSFLSMFHLKVNATKSILLTNLNKIDAEHLRNSEIKVDGIALTDIRSKGDITRILGVFLTADGDNHRTIQHAITQVDNMLKIIKWKFTPGPLIVYLINMVFIPILAYRLQVTPVLLTKLNEINTMFRKITRAKFNFSYASNSTIYDQELGISVHNFQAILDQRQITNALLHQRNTSELGYIHRYMVGLLTLELELPVDIMVCPVKTEKRPNPTILHVSNILFHYDLQFRTLYQNQSNNILLKITPDSYNEYCKIFMKLNIFTRDDITKRPMHQPCRYLRTRYPNQGLLSFAELYQSLPKYLQNNQIFHQYKLDLVTPRFYQALILLYSTQEETAVNAHLLDRNHTFSIRQVSPDWTCMQEKPLPINVEEQNLRIYTDGSFKDGILGAAAVIYSYDRTYDKETEIDVRMSRPTATLATPSKAEKHGILNALMATPYHAKLEIMTDSEESLNAIRTITSGITQDRQFLKLQNHATLTSIKYEMSQFITKPEITWVPAHVGIIGNERADKIAKEARLLETSTHPYLAPTISNLPQNTFLHLAGTLQEKYAATYVKEFNFRNNKNKTDAVLKKAYQSFFPKCLDDVNWTMTKVQASCRSKKKNFLDASHYTEQKFRINLLADQLPLKAKLHKQGIVSSPICPRCNNSNETQHHLLVCPNTVKIKAEIINGTYDLFKKMLPVELHYKGVDWERELIPRDAFLNEEEIQYQPWYFGFITETDQYFMKEQLYKSQRIPHKMAKLLLSNLVEAWLSTLYQLVWLPRAKLSVISIKQRKYEKRNAQVKNRARKQATKQKPAPAPEREDSSSRSKRPAPSSISNSESHKKQRTTIVNAKENALLAQRTPKTLRVDFTRSPPPPNKPRNPRPIKPPKTNFHGRLL